MTEYRDITPYAGAESIIATQTCKVYYGKIEVVPLIKPSDKLSIVSAATTM